MTTRVYLLADFGKGPNFVAFASRNRQPGYLARYHPRGAVGHELWVTLSALDAQDAARRWWLVECESAEAGRALISENECERGPGHWFGTVIDGPDSFKVDSVRPCLCGKVLGKDTPGRILDSRTNEAVA